jgi:acetyl esterase/lipase
MKISRREFGLAGCGTALALVMPGSAMAEQSSVRPASGTVSTIDPLSLVDPELLKFMPALRTIGDAANSGSVVRDVAHYRGNGPAATKWTFAPSPPVEERMIPGLPGQPDVRVFVVGAAPGQRKPAMVNIHGGGFIAGRGGDAAPNMQKVAPQFDCVAKTVDYRLAPETRFPGV